MAPSFPNDDVGQDSAISSHQLAAAASPECPTSDLLGNFGDFAVLFAELERPAVIELGNPVPRNKYMPRARAGTCHAAHNRRLLGDES